MIDAREIEIETCAYKDCGYLFVDIQCHYWQFHPQFIKPNTNQAKQTNKKVTKKGFQEVHVTQKESNQSEDTEKKKTTKLPGKQGLLRNYTNGLPRMDEQTPLTPQCKSDSNSALPAGREERDIPESKEEENGDAEVENDKARSQSSEKREKEYSTREELVLSMSKHMTNLDSLNISGKKGNGSKVKTNIKCEADGSHNKIRLTRAGIEEVTDKKEERNNNLEEKDFVAEIKPPEGIQPGGRYRVCKNSKSSTGTTRYFK